MIYESVYEGLRDACSNFDLRRERLAKAAIERWLEPSVGPSLSSDKLIAHIIADAMLRRMDHRLVESKNIYLESFDISQIELFYAMTKGYPQVPKAHDIANQYLAHELAQHERASFVEIGIGRGLQVKGVIERLAQAPGKLRDLTVLAIDPDVGNLTASRVLLEGLTNLPFAFRVHMKEGLLERFDRADFADLAHTAGDVTVMNSAYTIHHTVHPLNNQSLRTDLFRSLREAFRPRLFTLVEPNANHDTEHLGSRLKACFEHFGTVFDLVDRSGLTPEEKFVIKEKFFGREIRDIFGTSDAFRCERHETVDSWLLRLVKSGWAPYDALGTIDVRLPTYCSAAVDDGLVQLGYRGLPLLAVFAYRGSHDLEGKS